MATECPDEICEYKRKNKDASKPFVLSNWRNIVATNCGGHVKFEMSTRYPSVGVALTGNEYMCLQHGRYSRTTFQIKVTVDIYMLKD